MVMRKGKLLMIAGVLTTIGLLLASCGPAAEQPATGGPATGQPTGEQPTGGQPTTGQTAAGAPKGEITVALTISGFRTMLDQTTCSSASGTPIKMLLFDSLVFIDSNAKLQPALAESWKIADDWSKVDFTIRQGVKWSNGDPVTAKDIKFTLDKFMEPTSFYNYTGDFTKYVKEVKVVDDYHVSFLLNAPFPVIFDRLNDTGGMVPKDYYEKMGAKEFAAKPVGAGPFKAIDFKQDQWLNVEAVPNHYRKTPILAKVHIVYVPEPTTQVAMLKTGEVDMIAVEAPAIPDVTSDPRLRLTRVDYYSQTSVCFHDMMNPKEGSPFLDLRVRQAVSLAVDRVTVCKKVFYDAYIPGSQFLAPYNAGYDTNLPVLPYDPVKAKQLLAEAGYPSGFDTTLTYSLASKTQNEVVSAYLREVGIRAKLVPMESGSYSTKRQVSAKDPQAAVALRGLTLHSVPTYNGITHSGAAVQSQMAGGSLQSAGLTNPRVAALIEESMKYKEGDPKLAEVAKKFNELALAELWHAPLWVVNSPWGLGPKIDSVVWKPGRNLAILFEYMTVK